MTPIRIDIPDAPVTPVARAAGQLVIDALREAGIDPRKAAGVPMVVQMAGMWARGEWTRDQFVRAARNVGILNPALCA
jgi:hypothetical protein